MKRTLKIISLILSALMITGVMPVFSLAADTGINGNNLSYTIDAEGTLTLTGSGAMADGMITASTHNVKKVVIGNEVTVIGERAFYQFKDLEAVEFIEHSKVQRIDKEAFRACSKLKNFEVPASVKFIDSAAFFDSGLTAFTAEAGSTVYTADSQGILYRGTELCICPPFSALTEITVPSNVTKIGKLAFGYNENLQKITINANTEIIDDYAFQFAKNLNTVEFAGKSKLRLIGEYAFRGTDALKGFELPSGVGTIDKSAFEGSGIASFSFGANSKTGVIGEKAFCNCTKLEKFTFPASVKNIGKNVLVDSGVKELIFEEGCSAVIEDDFPINMKLTKLSYPAEVKIPVWYLRNNLTAEGLKTSDLPYYVDDSGALFSEDKKELISVPDSITEYTVPGGTEKIGNYAFSSGNKIEKLTLPAGLKEISEINYFNNLKEISVPENCYINMKGNGFKNSVWYNNQPDGLVILAGNVIGWKGAAPSYKNLDIPEGVKAVANNALREIEWAEEVNLPASLEKIGEFAFYNCGSLKSINIPEVNSLYEIGLNAFQYTRFNDERRAYFGNVLMNYDELDGDRMKDTVTGIAPNSFPSSRYVGVTLPSSVKYISPSAFKYAVKLTRLSFEDGSAVEFDIYDGSLYSSNLKELEIPGGAFIYDFNVFNRTPSVEKIKVNENNPYYTAENGILYNKDKTIVYKCFQEANKDEKIILPDTVEVIYANAFKNCNAKEIVLPSALREIGANAFESSYDLEKLDLRKCVNLERIGKSAFQSTVIKELYIPSKVADFSPDNGIYCLEKYEVSPDNPVFRAVDGVLYKHDILIHYPAQKKDKSFSPVPGTKEFREPAMNEQKYIEELIMPSSVSYIGAYALDGCTSLMHVSLPDNTVSIYFDNCPVLARVDFNACRFTGSLPGYTGIFGEENSLAGKFATDKSLKLYSPEDIPEMEVIPEIPAKCEETGMKAYYKTSDGTEYIDPYGVIKKTEENSHLLTIRAAGHKPQNKVSEEYLIRPATCKRYAEYHVSCAVCGKIMTQSDMPSYSVTFRDLEGGKAPHDYSAKKTDKKHLKSPATCTKQAEYYYECSVCGEISTDKTFTAGEPLPHTFDKKDTDKKYLKAPATCLKAAEYYYSCSVCGQKGTDTFTVGEPLPHTFDKKDISEKTLKSHANLDRGAEYYYTCSVCGKISDKDFFIYGDPLPAGDVDMNGEITAADARLALRASVQLEELTAEQLIISEVDGEPGLTAADARFILRMSVGLEEYIKK